jgi:guanyl-specific ribonuclease Sa
MSGKSQWSVLVFLLAAFLSWQGVLHLSSLRELAPATWTTGAPEEDRGRQDRTAGIDASDDALPVEARETLQLIASHGPFPYDRDGVVFGNFEHRLPEQPRGYYREYTVPTPGAHNRGARRIITGGDPPRAYYYTDDHYQSFRQIEARP